MRLTTMLVLLILAPHLVAAQQSTPQGFVPPNGFVPDSGTAVRVAVAVWIPIYGASQIRSEQPYVATLKQPCFMSSMGRSPGGVSARHGIEDRQEFPHARDQRHLRGLSGSP